MGAAASVRIANIYMHKFLQKFFEKYAGPKPPFIGRLIDDIFTKWSHGLDALHKLLQDLNSHHRTIKFEMTYSDTLVHFLDTTTYLDGGQIKTKLYVKPTDRKQYLHYTSAHPKHVKHAIPVSQALRYRRLTCEDEILSTELSELKDKFLSRGYPRNLIEEQIGRAAKLKRPDTLVYKTRQQKQDGFAKFTKGGPFLPLIVTYSPSYVEGTDNIRTILRELWLQMCNESETLKDTFGHFLPQIVFKRGKTLANSLISAKFPAPWLSQNSVNADENVLILAGLLAENENSESPDSNMSRCNKPRCKCCVSVVSASSFTSSVTKKQYKIQSKGNCSSANIVYLITCSKCHKQYVGETGRSLRERLNNHRSDIKLKKHTAIAIHFNDVQHSVNNLSITIIEDCTAVASERRQDIEKQWIRELQTGYPTGLNYYPL